jgi:T-complex protein 1 subunit eta
VRRAVKNAAIVPGGGAIDMEISRHLRDFARTIPVGLYTLNAVAL